MTLIGLAAVAVAGRRRRRRRRRRRSAPCCDSRTARTARRSSRRSWRGGPGPPRPPDVATLVTLLALGPLLLLPGPAGALVRPALLTFALALAARFVVALVVTPGPRALLLYRGRAGGAPRPARPAPGPGAAARPARAPGRSAARLPRRARSSVLLALLAVPALVLSGAGDRCPRPRTATSWSAWRRRPAPHCPR